MIKSENTLQSISNCFSLKKTKLLAFLAKHINTRNDRAHSEGTEKYQQIKFFLNQ